MTGPRGRECARTSVRTVGIAATALALGVFSSGCLTIGATMATGERDEIASIAAVRAAHATERSVFVEVEARFPGDRRARTRLVEIPLGAERALGCQAYDGVYGDSMSSVAADWRGLGRPGDLPGDAHPVEIRSVHVDALGELPFLLASAEHRVLVFAISYTPDPSDPGYAIPREVRARPGLRQLIAVIDPADRRRPFLVLGLHRTYRRWGWFALTPLTAAADLATLPLQILLSFALWDC